MKKKVNTFGNALRKSFTFSRIIVTVWNIIAFGYHFFFIGFDTETSIVIQVTAFIIEYAVSGIYERWLIWSNDKVNTKTKTGKYLILKKITTKYLVFTSIFVSIYVVSYYLRLELFYHINFGVDLAKMTKSITNMLLFALIAGPLMGMLVIRKHLKKTPPV